MCRWGHSVAGPSSRTALEHLVTGWRMSLGHGLALRTTCPSHQPAEATRRNATRFWQKCLLRRPHTKPASGEHRGWGSAVANRGLIPTAIANSTQGRSLDHFVRYLVTVTTGSVGRCGCFRPRSPVHPMPRQATECPATPSPASRRSPQQAAWSRKKPMAISGLTLRRVELHPRLLVLGSVGEHLDEDFVSLVDALN